MVSGQCRNGAAMKRSVRPPRSSVSLSFTMRESNWVWIWLPKKVRAAWQAGADASPYATWACPVGWLDDFAADAEKIDVPALILHGTADRVLPIDGQGRRLHAALPEAKYVEIEGGPHLVCVTHADEVNRELLAFLAAG